MTKYYNSQSTNMTKKGLEKELNSLPIKFSNLDTWFKFKVLAALEELNERKLELQRNRSDLVFLLQNKRYDSSSRLNKKKK